MPTGSIQSEREGRKVDKQNFHQSTGQHYMNSISLQVPQSLAGISVIIHIPAEHSCSTNSVNQSVNKTVCERTAFHYLKCDILSRGIYRLRFGQRMCQFQPHAADTVSIPSGRRLGFLSIHPIRQGSILGYKKEASEAYQREGSGHASSR